MVPNATVTSKVAVGQAIQRRGTGLVAATAATGTAIASAAGATVATAEGDAATHAAADVDVAAAGTGRKVVIEDFAAAGRVDLEESAAKVIVKDASRHDNTDAPSTAGGAGEDTRTAQRLSAAHHPAQHIPV